MLPKTHSRLQLGDALTAEDMFSLNQVPKVQIEREKHGDRALNDLVLEISHFVDEEAINRVEMEMLSTRVKKEWDLPEDFQIMETKNKEIFLVLNELEEVAWRMAGSLDEKDRNTLKAMFSINRNMDDFDRRYFEQDLQSLDEFVAGTNVYDDRINLLREWVVRKEEEIKTRVALPPKHLQKSDQQLHQRIEPKLKKARQALVAKLLEKDQFGNALGSSYEDLNTGDLSRIAEQLVVRLNLFNG